MRKFFLSFIIAIGFFSSAFAEAPFAQKLDAFLEKSVADETIVGAVVLVGQDGQVTYQHAVGYADRENKIPVQEDTQFRLASMTKAIVSAATLSLVEQGIVTLDDPITKWVPDFKPKLPDGTEPIITIRHLLTHTSGLTYNFSEANNPEFEKLHIDSGLGNDGLTIEENMHRIAQFPLRFKPGNGWWYSYATDVLGGVIAHASGKSLPELVKERVTQPLGMNRTGFVVSDSKTLAVPYAAGKPPVRMKDGDYAEKIRFYPSRALSDKNFASGGAGLLGTAHDYFLFLEAIRRGENSILKAETLREMLRNQTGDLKIGLAGPGWSWNLAFALLKDRDLAHSPMHNGSYAWSGIYGSHFWVDPEAQLTVVILTNTVGVGHTGPFPDTIRDIIYQSLEMKQ